MKKIFWIGLLAVAFWENKGYGNIVAYQPTLLTVVKKGLALKVKTKNENINNPPLKIPVVTPEVELLDGVLYFITPCDGCVLRLVQEKTGHYETVIKGNTMELPTIFQGTYELQIMHKWFFFKQQLFKWTSLVITQLLQSQEKWKIQFLSLAKCKWQSLQQSR